MGADYQDYTCPTNVSTPSHRPTDQFIQFIWNKWSRWEVKMSWCEYSAFYSIYLSESNFSTFYFWHQVKSSRNIKRYTWAQEILHKFKLLYLWKVPACHPSWSFPAIIAAIKTEARHWDTALAGVVTICLAPEQGAIFPYTVGEVIAINRTNSKKVV